MQSQYNSQANTAKHGLYIESLNSDIPISHMTSGVSIKHLGIQTAYSNICNLMGCWSWEFRGTVLRLQCAISPIMSSLFAWPTVCCIITRWK
ncbi:hypothetical protein GDO86_016906 [Hymenochirus boettgeri]|uniref:Uncharacterized protein n=1 Tax=Hymenochirus boettgeri TaxID=247094 RepID=A0A8T2IPJ2_9PIPI|nr:hypothetical protein GDO86_016906 [Hymenochirus boettgeri]